MSTSSNTNIFEQASKTKLRFQTPSGILNVEDLWNLSLEQLDKLAQSFARKVESSRETSYIPSFVTRKTKEEMLNILRFEIIKHIIVSLAEEQQEKLEARAKKEKKDKILALIAEKQDDALKSKSIEELMKELED